jgi:hypothetical protein
MRFASPRAAVAALAVLLAAGAPARAQDAGLQMGVSTGRNLLPLSLSLIEATRAGVVFEAVPDTRFRVVRHTATRFPCIFLPTSEALVSVVAPAEGAAAGEDAVCFESVEGTDLAYRISRFPGQPLEDVFAGAVRTAAGGWLIGEIFEAPSAPNLDASPHQPDVALDMPRRQVLLLGASEQGPAALRIAVVQLPGDWYVTQNYFAPLTDVEEGEQAGLASVASALAEAALVFRLSEMRSPTRDPALAGR